MRGRRDQMLFISDWSQLADNELTDAEKEKIVHDSSQVVPVSAKNSRTKGIGRYL
mgnify:CR=1 FL=1